MACKNKCSKNGILTEKEKTVLAVFSKQTAPVGGKDIAAVSRLESKVVSSQIKALKEKGMLVSPVRCKYSITEVGKEAL